MTPRINYSLHNIEFSAVTMASLQSNTHLRNFHDLISSHTESTSKRDMPSLFAAAPVQLGD